MTRYLKILMLSIFAALPIAAQPMQESLGEFYSYGDRYHLEVATMPGNDAGKGRAVVTFRLSYDILTFRQRPQASGRSSSAYYATPSVLIEAVSSEGVTSGRGVWRDTITVFEYSQTNAKDRFASGTIELALRPGLYSIKYSLVDEAPEAGFSETTPQFKMDDFASPSPAIGLPLFLRSISGDTLTATAIGGGAYFGERLRVYVPLSSVEEPKELRYELLSVAKSERRGRESSNSVQTGLAKLIGQATLGPAITSGNEIYFRLRQGDTSVPARSFAAVIDARTDDLDIGDYILLLSYSAGFNSVTDSVRFRLRWVDQPVALFRSAYAIRALYPIATDGTIDSLLAGTPEEQSAGLRHYWRRFDPTPSTRYNEAMAEYYRRVDYAYFNFKSISQKDGAFTDRGKIYILHGPPTEVSRQMRPDASPTEVWTYRNKVGQVFVFVDAKKTGEYRLAEYHDL